MGKTDAIENEEKAHKHHVWRYLIVVLLLLAVVGVGLYYYLTYTTYDHVQTLKQYENKNSGQGNYTQYLDGILEYSRDGIALLSKKGEEIWNQPCQMSSPIVEVCKESAAVADKGGTSIFVFHKGGLKGEIQTTKTIEKLAVSKQGIVAVILKDEANPVIMCYDAKGNPLVEQITSLKRTGYPIDIAISEDGTVMLVSYLQVKGSGVSTRVVYYNFGAKSGNQKEHVVAEKEYDGVVIPTAAFLNERVSLLVSDQSLIYYEGTNQPKEMVTVPIQQEIKSVAYHEGYVGLILKRAGEEGNELRLYNKDGKMLFSVMIEGEYSNIKIKRNQVLLYDGNLCTIYNTKGVCRFSGSLDKNILDIFPVGIWNKYMVISANGLEEIQLAN